jgi:hypothetical protein
MYLSKHVFTAILQDKSPLPSRLTQNTREIIIQWKQDSTTGDKNV